MKKEEKSLKQREIGLKEGWLIKLPDGTYRIDLFHPKFRKR